MAGSSRTAAVIGPDQVFAECGIILRQSLRHADTTERLRLPTFGELDRDLISATIDSCASAAAEDVGLVFSGARGCN